MAASMMTLAARKKLKAEVIYQGGDIWMKEEIKKKS